MGALISAFTGGGGIGSGLTDVDDIGDGFLGVDNLLPPPDICCGVFEGPDCEYLPGLVWFWFELFLLNLYAGFWVM